MAGTTLGTVDYLAPEQARDSGAADVRSDIYSLGCTWYHMLAGRAPFAEGTAAERLHKQVSMPPADIRKINPRVPDSVNRIVLKMLAKNPVERYQTPEELLRAGSQSGGRISQRDEDRSNWRSSAGADGQPDRSSGGLGR